MRHLLAAIDFSDATGLVLEAAASLAEAFDAELTLLHVAAPDPDFVGYEAGPDSVRDARARVLREEHRKLQERAEALRDRGVRARALMIEGPTAETVLAEAERASADAIVMGCRGLGALRRALLGSTSEAVLRGARVPVTLVPPGAHASG